MLDHTTHMTRGRTQVPDQPQHGRGVRPGGQLPAQVLVRGDDGIPGVREVVDRPVLRGDVGLQVPRSPQRLRSQRDRARNRYDRG